MNNTPASISEYLKQKDKIVIGRSKQCDIRLESEYVSRKHCIIFRDQGKIYIEDLNSRNGTYVNQLRINKRVVLNPGDEVIVGFYLFTLNHAPINLQLLPVIKFTNASIGTSEKEIIKPFSWEVSKAEFWAIMGPSGSGKSTLIKSITGDMSLLSGHMSIHGLDSVEYRKFIQSKIGYVPQFDVLHNNLTVYENLYYHAKIKYGQNISNQNIKKKILWALERVKMNHSELINKQVKYLSGGQIKRVSIAMELMDTPSILILDEATSPLDPETIKEFMFCLKEIQQQGTSVILVTHKPDDLNYADNIFFIGSNGYPIYKGSKNNILSTFGIQSIYELYELASNKSKAEEYYENYFKQEATSTHIAYNNWNEAEKPKIADVLKDNLYKLFWTTVRLAHVKIKSGWIYWLLIIGQPLLISALIYLMFNKIMLGVLFILVLSCIWFGVSNSARDIVDELHIFQKEYKNGLSISNFLISKIFIISIITIIQCCIIVLVLYKAYAGDYIHLNAPERMLVHCSIIGISSVILGLFISSLFKTSEQVMSIVPLTLIPQIMLNGVISDLDSKEKEMLSYLTISRWGTELLCIEQDESSDLYEEYTVLYSPIYDTTYKIIYPCRDLYYLYCEGCNTVRIKIPEKINVHYQSHYEYRKLSLYTYKPSVIKDTLLVKKEEADTLPKLSDTKKLSLSTALELSGFKKNYANYKDSLKNKYLALIVLNCITFLFTFISIRNKIKM